MSDDHKSEQVVDSIGIGKLYDPPNDFFEKFFESDNGGLTAKQLYFKEKRGIKIEKNYLIPSQRIELNWPVIVGYKKVETKPDPNLDLNSQELSEWPFQTRYRNKIPIYSKTNISICNPQPTKPGPIFVVDEIKTGTRLKFYKVWINGQERYLTENQLKYVKEA